MKISIRAFGQLTDIIQTSEVVLEGAADTDSLVQALNRLYPALSGKQFIVAVDRRTITGNTGLAAGCTVALLPPFSGG